MGATHPNRGLTEVAALIFLALVPAALSPQESDTTGGGPPPAATGQEARALDRARDAQVAFERFRRSTYRRVGLATDVCHETVGRFCLNHDEDEGWAPAPEDPEVAVRRGWLLATLDSVAGAVPASDWVWGQRVRYLVEDGRADDAATLLDACTANVWWCDALRGFVRHEQGRYAEAGAAFDRVLAALPDERRCAWTDVSLLLERSDRSAYGRLACGPARDAWERAFWHLADPLWSVPGLERRSEHFVRRVRAVLQRDAASGYGLPWGDDLAEITVRYGWPAGWDVAWRRDPGVRTERAVQAHRSPDAQRFDPVDLSGGPAGAASWRLDDPRPRSTWAPPGGPVRPVDAQVASFWRGERRRVVAAFEAPEGLGGCPVRSELVLANTFGVVESARSAGTLPATIDEPEPAGRSTLIGVETACTDGAGSGRARLALGMPSKSLSDLLLLEAAATLPGTLDAAVPLARRRTTARAGERIALFWEWYGPPEGPGSLDVTLSLTREEGNFWRKALEWSGLADPDREEVGIRWSESAGDGGPGRALELVLPDLDPGAYRLTLTVQSARAGTVRADRDLRIVP